MSDLVSASSVQLNTYAGYVNSSLGYVSIPAAVAVPVRNPGATARESRKNTTAKSRTAYFDYVVAPSVNSFGIEETGTGVGDTNLGQVAASLREGPLSTQRNFTNDDIARLNGVADNNYLIPGASTEQRAYLQQQSQPQQPQPQPHSCLSGVPLRRKAKPSAFSPDSSMQQTPSQKANVAASESTQPGRITTPTRPGSEAGQSGNETSRASGQQDSSESQSSAQASTQRKLPTTSLFLPLVVLCGVGITALGILLASRR